MEQRPHQSTSEGQEPCVGQDENIQESVSLLHIHQHLISLQSS